MIPYVLPVGLFVVLVLLRRRNHTFARIPVVDAAAWSLSALLVVTGISHFSGLREELIRMVPPDIQRPDRMVSLIGFLELTGAAAFAWRPTRNAAGVALALLFVALLPANIYAAQNGLTLGGKPVTPLWLRIPEQILFIAFALTPLTVKILGPHLRRPKRPESPSPEGHGAAPTAT